MTSITDDLLDTVAAGSHHDPHSVLGMHLGADAEGAPEWTIRARRPLARSVTAVFADGTRVPLEHVRAGIWEGQRSGERGGAYELVTTYEDGPDYTADDPYRFGPAIGELDLHLIREGRHEELWRVLGAHVREFDGTQGTSFTVWAPNARAVRVVGDFNGWDGPAHAMRSMGASGVWELFVPGIGVGTTYKFQLLSRGRRLGPEGRPDGALRRSASGDGIRRHGIVVLVVGCRLDEDPRAPASPCRSPCRSTKSTSRRGDPGCRTATVPMQLIDYVTAQGFTHIEFLPLVRAPVRRVVGLSGHRLLLPHEPVRHTRRPALPDRPPAPGRHRRDHGLGARSLPEGCLRARPLRRRGAVRAPRSAPRRAPRLGHLHLRLRAQRGAQLPRRERAVLVRGVPRRRTPRRRRGLDAVPRLLARGRRVGSERPRRPREPRGDPLPAGGHRDRRTSATPASR